MAAPRPPHDPPPAGDADGVRVVPTPRGRRRLVAGIVAVAVIVAIGGAAVWLLRAPSEPSARVPPADGNDSASASAAPAAAARPAYAAQARPLPGQTRPAPGEDRNDLAAWFAPGDPEPTGAELIQALHETGIRTGIGAFNPPGTSPPLAGLAVPDGFVLPEGYVRHHQVTDDGEPIPPILMFAPDFVLRDVRGRPVAMPDDRVVPPELAPPGLPLRRVRIPPGP